MDFTLWYFGICVGMALLIMYEALLLKKLAGKFQGNNVLASISAFEFIWLMVSGVALYQLEFVGLSVIVPVVYILHNFVGWGYGMYLFKKEGLVEQLEQGNEDDIAIPLKFTDFTLSFGLVFLVLSALACINHLRPDFLSAVG